MSSIMNIWQTSKYAFVLRDILNLSNIYDGAFWLKKVNGYSLLTIFAKMLYYRYLMEP